MSRFIKLTVHGDTAPLFLRWDLVDLVFSAPDGGTYVQLSQESRTDCALVNETPEEVAKLIEEADALEWGATPPWLKKPEKADAE